MRLHVLLATALLARQGAQPTPTPAHDAPIQKLVAQLDLERYKSTIKGLTQFGDRRQGTDRNSAAIAWIEAQLKSYGCTNTERLSYNYQPAPVAQTQRGGGNRGRGNQTAQ